jgi:thiosulfate reductase cytochrome b subunit
MKTILYPLSVRIWHWGQALAMIVLMLTGVQLRFPDYVSVFGRLQNAVTLHNVAGWAVLLGWIAWLVMYAWRRDLFRQYVLRPRDLGEIAAKQVAYYAYGIFHGWAAPFHPTPKAKFNPLQKLSYMGVMFVLVPIQALTGLFLWDLDRFRGVVDFLGGIRLVDGIHVFVAYALVAFLMMHIYLSTLGATFTSHIKAMIVGYEDEANHASGEPTAANH